MENETENEAVEDIFAGADVVGDTEARVNITWSGQNGDMQQPIPYDAADGDIKQWCSEAITAGSVPGITADEAVDFGDFVVDRFAASEARPFNLVQLRPKTPFGG